MLCIVLGWLVIFVGCNSPMSLYDLARVAIFVDTKKLVLMYVLYILFSCSEGNILDINDSSLIISIRKMIFII